ncbi:hypothetical protein ID855_06090 [Xenorhabdus sp. ZM]|uniref:hypothetical protein n=1 Tax=Xenorhabdus szentirmaii TaxID=290112 RepID=UPI001984B730|nr:hypothetical protein [Xenorhabdus sp. ZM]MBD2804273.1 hypothetical protein [Xenorhabdus sp. ZM]
MEITHYTTKTLITLANKLNIDPHDSALPYILARHLYSQGEVTDTDGAPCDHKTLLTHLLKSLK